MLNAIKEKKEKTPKESFKTRFSKKFKKFKDDIKLKTKEQLSAARATSRFFLILVLIFRIAIIFFWIIAPIMMTLAFAYDPGTRNLVWYICATVVHPKMLNGEVLFTVDIAYVNNVINIAAPIIWFASFLLIFLCVVLPFFYTRKWAGKAFFAFNLFFWPLFFLGIDYAIYFLKSRFPMGPDIDINGPQYPLRISYLALNETYTFKSPWNIVYQITWCFLLLVGVFVSVEAGLIKSYKLDYDDLYSQPKVGQSLVDNVIEGRLEFGEIKSEDLNTEIKNLRKDLIDEDRQRRIDRLEKIAEERKARKLAKKNKYSKNKSSEKIKKKNLKK
ncbi:hypothetical protein [Spiroplasma tabanidicola]|uniref:Transmembrane protein n=1 Tax=Spiroplasma tabanidicola TaxID=324079 RepID=A0A6I6C9N1_9MOLU|nr:hypothetical protein [Spiroplasma tabanidicola]QGS51635.1 hypothetical protein STABA_v1c02690 [Spiroplasma tabanidicola]